MQKGRSFRVEWARVALEDVLQIYKHLSSQGSERSQEIVESLLEAATELKHMPLRGRVVPELERHGIVEYRERILVPWRLVYRIRGDMVCIMAVLDGRRNVEDLLLDRFTR